MHIAIGDIHGHFQLLERLLDQVLPSLAAEDRLVFMGDYIDRGPESRRVLGRVVELKRDPRVVALMGNHEDMALAARDEFLAPVREGNPFLDEDGAFQMWFPQGGMETLMSYGLDPEASPDGDFLRWPEFVPAEHWDFMESALPEYIADKLHFVHAGILPPGHTDWEESSELADPRLWIRDTFLDFRGSLFGRRVVFGHTPQPGGRPLVMANKIGIDTGAAFGGPLTAVRLEDDGTIVEFVQADERSTWTLDPEAGS